MYWDRPLTVLLLILRPPPQVVNSSLLVLTGMFIFHIFWEAHYSLFDKNLIYVAGQQLLMQS